MVKKYAGLVLLATLALAQQQVHAIHLKDKDGNFIAYDHEKKEISTTKEESKAARFLITPAWKHDKDQQKQQGKSKKGPRSKPAAKFPRHFKLLLHNKGSSVLFPMGWNGETLFVPCKRQQEESKAETQPKSKGKGTGIKSKMNRFMHKGQKKDWKKFAQMTICSIEGIEVTPDTTNEQLDEQKVIFIFKKGKKEITKELFFERGAQEKRHHEGTKETKEEAKKEETTKKEEVKEEQKAKEEAAH